MIETGQQVQKLLELECNTSLYKLNFPMKPAAKPCENIKGRAVEKERNSGPYCNGDELK